MTQKAGREPTEVVSPHGNDGTSSDIDWDLREREVSGYVLGTTDHLTREPGNKGALHGNGERRTKKNR